jgi:hypothetical protein
MYFPILTVSNPQPSDTAAAFWARTGAAAASRALFRRSGCFQHSTAAGKSKERAVPFTPRNVESPPADHFYPNVLEYYPPSGG